jgi:hypothetical protein
MLVEYICSNFIRIRPRTKACTLRRLAFLAAVMKKMARGG